MIIDHYDDRTIANMEVALGRACDRFPRELANYKARKRVAAKLLVCATSGERTLQGFTDAAMAAAVITSNRVSPKALWRSSRTREEALLAGCDLLDHGTADSRVYTVEEFALSHHKPPA
jgi:hypothetical protein